MPYTVIGDRSMYSGSLIRLVEVMTKRVLAKHAKKHISNTTHNQNCEMRRPITCSPWLLHDEMVKYNIPEHATIDWNTKELVWSEWKYLDKDQFNKIVANEFNADIYNKDSICEIIGDVVDLCNKDMDDLHCLIRLTKPISLKSYPDINLYDAWVKYSNYIDTVEFTLFCNYLFGYISLAYHTVEE